MRMAPLFGFMLLLSPLACEREGTTPARDRPQTQTQTGRDATPASGTPSTSPAPQTSPMGTPMPGRDVRDQERRATPPGTDQPGAKQPAAGSNEQRKPTDPAVDSAGGNPPPAQ